MPPDRPDRTTATARDVTLVLGECGATTTTRLVVGRPRARLTLLVDHELLEVRTDRVASLEVADGALHLQGVAPGARIAVTGRAAYRSTPHGLARLVDPDDGRGYVVASGALGGAAHFLVSEPGPDDRALTTLRVTGARGPVVATGTRCAPGFVSTVPLAGHHLALAAGPWVRHGTGGLVVLTRRALRRPRAVHRLLEDTRRALAWVGRWFGGGAPWGGPYVQVLLPDPPWSAMEHPGCVLVSERLLDDHDERSEGRRMAVLAHEAAHQWVGNLVSPRCWADVGVFEGLAELVGQLACDALLGEAAVPYLTHRRAVGPLPAVRGAELAAASAGLAEIAGPVQHAELFRQVRSDLGAGEFRARLGRLCREAAGTTLSSDELWSTLGAAPRRPARVRLPAPPPTASAAALGLARLACADPSTAVIEARRAFRTAPAGRGRVESALAALADPALPRAVSAGVGAELAAASAGVVARAGNEKSGARSNLPDRSVISISLTD